MFLAADMDDGYGHKKNQKVLLGKRQKDIKIPKNKSLTNRTIFI